MVKLNELFKNILGDNYYDIHLMKKFPLGTFYDEEKKIWFRNIYIPDSDLLRIQFLTFYELNLKIIDKEIFNDWCDKNEMYNTKKMYEILKSISFKNCQNRKLIKFRRKGEIHLKISDFFFYKGFGPVRAITVYGNTKECVESSLNALEYLISLKSLAIVRDNDNLVFPNFKYDYIYELTCPIMETHKEIIRYLTFSSLEDDSFYITK